MSAPAPLRCSSIAAIPAFTRLLLLLRHAERAAITDIRTHASVMLTEQGRLDALALGRLIGARFRRAAVWHSPVPRCRETAESLAAGVTESGGEASVEGPLDWLGGDFIGGEAQWVNEEIAARGPDDFLRAWFDGAYPPDRIASLDEAAAFEMKEALRRLDDSPSPVALAVTHDWNLMLLRERYLGLRHEDVGVPAYLDSVALLGRDGVTTVWSLGRSGRLDSDAT